MPPPVRLSRNITDFFRPFSQPRNASSPHRSIEREPRTDHEVQTSSGYTEIEQGHQFSRGRSETNKQSRNSHSGSENNLGLGNELEILNKISPISDAGWPTSLAKDNGNAYDIARTSSLTPLSSDLPSPMEVMKPTSDEISNVCSTMPLNAEDSYISGSQRVVRNGEVVIANSDEETDSQESFEDLDQLLNLPTEVSRLSRSSPQPEVVETPYALRSKRTPAQKANSGPSLRSGLADTRNSKSATHKTAKIARSSLQMLVAQTAADQAVEAAAQQAEDSLKSLEDEQAARNSRHNGVFREEGEELVRNVNLGKGDEDTIGRLLRAVRRSEMLQREKVWSFFDTPSSDLGQKMVEFPDCRAYGRWASQMQVPALREKAFLSGFVSEALLKGRLPTEILCWVVDAMCSENAQILRDAYIVTLVDAGEQTRGIVSPNVIEQLFKRIGASNDALDLNMTVEATLQVSTTDGESWSAREWSRLNSILKLIARLSKFMETETRIRTLCLLCRLALDRAAMRNGQVIIAFEGAFTNLLGSIPSSDFEPELQTLLNKVSFSITDPQLQSLLLQSVPTSSARSSIVRRRLALAWLFPNDENLKVRPDPKTLFTKVIHILEEPNLSIHASTEFLHLVNVIALLDVAIGDGSPPQVPGSSKDAIHEFNKEVDKLAVVVKGMATEINDTGSANLLRAETKDLLESFLSRLAYTIRTKVKPRRDIFEDSKRVSQTGPKRNISKIDEYLARRAKDTELTLVHNMEEVDSAR